MGIPSGGDAAQVVKHQKIYVQIAEYEVNLQRLESLLYNITGEPAAEAPKAMTEPDPISLSGFLNSQESRMQEMNERFHKLTEAIRQEVL